jgi:hypothetical protein
MRVVELDPRSDDRHRLLRRCGRRKLEITVHIDDGRGKLNDHTLLPRETDPEFCRAAWRFVKKGMVDPGKFWDLPRRSDTMRSG